VRWAQPQEDLVTAGTLSAGTAAGISAATGAVAAGAATNATVSVVNNRGNLGAVFKDVTSSGAIKGYFISGVTAGLTAGLFDGWTGTETVNATGKIVTVPGALGTWAGVGQFAANQVLQNTTSTLLGKALGQGGDLGDALKGALFNTLAAASFNAIGDYTQGVLTEGYPPKVIVHAMVGGLLSKATGGDFKTGALAAGINEALVVQLDTLVKGDKDLLSMSSQIVGVLAAASQKDADAKSIEQGGWVAKNATQYNYLNHDQLKRAAKMLLACGDDECRKAVFTRYKELSFAQDLEAAAACSADVTVCAKYSRDVANTMANLDDIYQALGDGPAQEWEDLRQSNLGFQEMLATFTAGHTAGAIAEAVQQKWGLSDEQTKIVADNLVLVAAGGVAAIAAKKALAQAFGGAKAATKVITEFGPMNQGPLPKGIANTFRSGTYSEVVTQKPTTLYRVYGGTAQELGGYWTATKPAGPVQSIIDSALKPEWGNTATKVVKIEVPIGTKYFEGVAAPQGGLVGGGNQVLFPKDFKIDTSWIKQ
jgi:filamentous hemagglutinin